MFKIFTDTSSGMSKELRKQYDIDYFRMGIVVNGKEYLGDLDYEDFSREEMFAWVRDPNTVIRTSLATAQEFISKCEPYLEKGIDILYLACTDALSGTRGVFELLKEELKEKYPGRKIVSVNSCRCEMALGLMIIEAAKMRDAGKSMEEVIEWVENNKQYYHQIGSLETLKYLKMYGRVSGAAAFFADALNIKPLIMFDIHGHNYTFKKVHGFNKSVQGCFDYIKENVVEGETEVIYIGKTTDTPAYEMLKKKIEEQLKIEVRYYNISPIVSICCGPGMFGCWFRGKLVTAEAK